MPTLEEPVCACFARHQKAHENISAGFVRLTH
jgi:hypothetical protein